jgi:hypothetical protein
VYWVTKISSYVFARPSRRRQRLPVQLWGQLQRPCRVLGAATDSWSLQRRLLTLRRRVLPHVDHILDTVINVPLARFQGDGVRLADHCLEEARQCPLTLINHEVSPGPLLAPENLALQHPFSIPLYADAPFGLGDGDEARDTQDRQL